MRSFAATSQLSNYRLAIRAGWALSEGKTSTLQKQGPDLREITTRWLESASVFGVSFGRALHRWGSAIMLSYDWERHTLGEFFPSGSHLTLHALALTFRMEASPLHPRLKAGLESGFGLEIGQLKTDADRTLYDPVLLVGGSLGWKVTKDVQCAFKPQLLHPVPVGKTFTDSLSERSDVMVPSYDGLRLSLVMKLSLELSMEF